MTRPAAHTDTARSNTGRFLVYTAGFLTKRRIRRILTLAGHAPRLGWPGREGDRIGAWGHGAYAPRAERVAARSGAPILRVEDAFLRSLHPGRAGEPPLGLLIDDMAAYFDATRPSRLERLLATHPFDDAALLTRARDGIERMRAAHLSKYAATDPDTALPEAGYVLVIDQTRGDASIRLGRATPAHFKEMLFAAREAHPNARIVIKTHPEVRDGHRAGHFDDSDLDPRTSFFHDNASPFALLDGAVAVYTVTSQMGFEAILCGHRPHVFGQPFYAGWGLSEDVVAHERRHRKLTRVQLFAGAMLDYPVWYDPFNDRLGRFEDALGALEAMARAWREDHKGWTARGMRLWKRAHLKAFFGRYGRLRFSDTAPGRAMAWAGKAGAATDVVRVEDGFLRSRGLGAELIPPLSLVCDRQGIYYDPTRRSDLEDLIRARRALSPGQSRRVAALTDRIRAARLSKYNLGGAVPDLPPGHRVLVPGQVEDDASILKGAGKVATNADLLRAARAARPEAVLIYKPHPDVEAGLRAGAVPGTLLKELNATQAAHADPIALIDACDEVWTMTSLLGFEALMRDVPVTCTGAPFYAGWGLTTDIGPVPARRRLHVPLEGLIHAALIDYPRYHDPVSDAPCPVEVAVARLCDPSPVKTGLRLRLLAKLQGAFASFAWIWR